MRIPPMAYLRLFSCLASVFVAAITLGGCNTYQPENLGLGATREQAMGETRRMRETPVTVKRPIVVVSGWRTPGYVAARIAEHLRRTTSGHEADVLAISGVTEDRFDRFSDNLLRAVEAKWPSDDPAQTVEVDVVTFSAGALVARWAALPPQQRTRHGLPADPSNRDEPNAKRLRIARLYTIAGPHLGADIAGRVHADPMCRDMDPTSGFLTTLNQDHWPAEYETVCYTQIGDIWVGAKHAAPPGITPIWTHGSWTGGHFSSYNHPIFLADIARRIRGEMPLTVPGTPPPEE